MICDFGASKTLFKPSLPHAFNTWRQMLKSRAVEINTWHQMLKPCIVEINTWHQMLKSYIMEINTWNQMLKSYVMNIDNWLQESVVDYSKLLSAFRQEIR